ncbi:hypothetical protein I302_107820 [Kwoniella bestiolae CBS 10118]|uniref:Uncharacterized protein n=1 Tax=Kwoniella bestiolae CBS 10118 TaxID=1296100 RepID=A0A1B9FXF5_9TREE|nr:hypothetical protein I302_06440 [Kwoniella bestiolae CBS 10118]OCF23458.1 hypothetical protein I302_06440 [Kwoniella bestiolae CBS 10118]
MLTTFLALLPTSLALLWTSYGPPTVNGHTGLGIESLVEYKSRSYLTRSTQGELQGIKISMNGECWVGDEVVECQRRLVGGMASGTIPFLATLQIYYSLLTYVLLLGVLFHYSAKNQWASKRELIWMRRFTLVVMVIKDFVGVFGVLLSSLSLLLLPIIDKSINHINDVQLGWGGVISIFTVFGSGLLTAGYENWSDRLLSRAEHGIFLADEEINVNTLDVEADLQGVVLLDEEKALAIEGIPMHRSDVDVEVVDGDGDGGLEHSKSFRELFDCF